MKLNIGCGNKFKKDFINVDIRKLKGVNVVAKIQDLPFREQVFDEVEAIDVVEHVKRYEKEKVIQELYRVLKSNGILSVLTPNLTKIASFFLNKRIPFYQTIRLLYGEQDYEENLHCCLWQPEDFKPFQVVKMEEKNFNLSLILKKEWLL